jgi:2-C-methyl-D-erythritol 2,4-cyclodiphosphate synthase
MLQQRGWQVVNADLTIACEAPRVAPHAEQMRQAIASVLAIGAGDVSVKATTTEQLGFCGRGEGIAAMAVALIRRS